MKKIIFPVFILFLLSSCSYHVHHRHSHNHLCGHLPPGQAKKITGSKSAKPYAPGQHKKH